MKDSDKLVPDETYDDMLATLQNLGSVEKLLASPLASSCQVQALIEDDPGLTTPEALRKVLAELLDHFGFGNEEYAEILRLRFWERMTLDEVLDTDRFIYPKRTLQQKQSKGVHLLAQWFVLKEKVCTKLAESAQVEVTEQSSQNDFESDTPKHGEEESDIQEPPPEVEIEAPGGWEDEAAFQEDSQDVLITREPNSTEDFPKTPFKSDFEKRDTIQSPTRPSSSPSRPDSNGEPGLVKFLFMFLSPWVIISFIVFILALIFVFVLLPNLFFG